MDKQDIINYVLETPTNTNPAILGQMLDSLGGGVEMVTLFEDDITFTYQAGHDTYYNAWGSYHTTNSIKVPYGYLWVTLDDIVMIGLCSSVDLDNTGYCSFSCESEPFYLSSDSIVSYITVNNMYYEDERYISNNQLAIDIYKNIAEEAPDLQAYCQEPHHLKIEWFTI